ncbi:MAG: DUF433 domain-containing protein [Blastocatellia bacterium]
MSKMTSKGRSSNVFAGMSFIFICFCDSRGGCYTLFMSVQTVAQVEPKVIENVIWIDPERVSGAPCFNGTRVPIQNLFDYLEGGHTLEDFLEGFPPVTREQALKVLELARTKLFHALLNSENPSRP